MTLSAWWRTVMPPEADVRAEIWRLGARHLGSPLEGALDELGAPGVSKARAQLLRACIRELRR